MNDPSKVESILLAALEKATPEARSAYLDDVCRDNPGLREQVNRLLAAHPNAIEFLEIPAVAVEEKTAVYVPSVEKPGSILVGRYKLLEMIGEGGMGEVWVADQLEPIKRRVALKLIKPGMDSRSVLGRFEAERQALAVMDHPNIAKVLDAGSTDNGRPYFVMELVKGTPITEFCDARRLSPQQRLELFITVCQAIQHAHMKGIIHRDIKPSNVLVALHDETPVAKVIDFGVAKAIGQQLTEKTIYTGFGALVGTPTYMAPEQATFNQLDVDTRADVYALGVLLYELLAGSPPIEAERLKKAALDEILRIVRDEEPPRPSQRLSTSNTKASIASTRQSEPDKLSALMKGEIDWIVMKALEKDRTRRYETPNGLAKDIQRYLSGDSVEACPPTLGYRLRKAYRKNRIAIRVASAFICLALGAAVIGAYLAVKAKRAEAVAEQKQIESDKNAKRAERNEELYREVSLENMFGRMDAEVKSLGLRVDLDLNELKIDQAVGLLKLARPMQTTFGPLLRDVPQDEQLLHFETTFSFENRGDYQALREYVTATVITVGQLYYAHLRPPLPQDRDEQLDYMYSPDGSTFLTVGHDDKAIRLWDARTASLNGKLHEDDEVLVNLGSLWGPSGPKYSPDSKTVSAHDQTGVIRFWSAETAKLLSKVEGKHELTFELGNDRFLAKTSKAKRRPNTDDNKVIDLEFSGPVELWDTQAGKSIARLDQPESDLQLGFHFVNQSNWIATREGKSMVVIYSANDGRVITRLVHPTGGEFLSFDVSPNGKRVAVLAKKTSNSNGLYVWDSNPWRLLPQNDELERCSNSVSKWFGFWTDDLAIINTTAADTYAIYDFLGSNQLWNMDVTGLITNDGFMWDQSGIFYDIKTKTRLVSPPGRKYHPALVKFAQDGRFVKTDGYLIDSVTEKSIPLYHSLWQFNAEGTLDGFGSFFHYERGDLHKMALFPAPRFLKDIPPELLQLWIQVAVRGELGAAGEFVAWNEESWDKKQQELATFPPPHPEFPFPGFLATDKLHWLRAEFQAASDNSEQKRALAEKLLRRAEEVGNTVEANRWQAWLKR